jgi:hypothetical protein
MIATVLVGPGKPKLVQIQRPHSRSPRRSPAEDSRPPGTPEQAPLEVSAFSPYDTPCNDAAHAKQLVLSPPKEDTQGPVQPQQSTTPERSRSIHFDSVSTALQQYHHRLSSCVETPPRRIRSNRSMRTIEKRWAIRGSEIVLHNLQAMSPKTRSATWSRCKKLDRALNAVSRAINDFPADMLQLDSPAVLDLRNPSIPDRTYLDALQRIFPMAPAVLASALAAWIIIDVHFAKLRDQAVSMETYLAAQKRLSDEGLDRIPDKAREMLGIGLPDAAMMKTTEAELRQRAMAVEASINVVGQRLVEALRGSRDEDIWRSLRVLVEVIESFPGPWG